VIVVLVALAVIAIVVLARRVLGGNHETNSESSSLTRATSTGDARADAPDPYRECFHEKAMREACAAPEPKPDSSALVQEAIHGWSGETHDAADQEFEALIATIIPVEAQEQAFYVKVRGTSHRNSDRTLRTRIIGECSTFDTILLVPEPENPFGNGTTIAVCRESNEQLGYIESRLAGEITRDEAKHGPHWIAFFRRKTHHPESGRTAGAVIRVIRLSDEFIANSDAVKAIRVT
jgi:hypothetical protein